LICLQINVSAVVETSISRQTLRVSRTTQSLAQFRGQDEHFDAQAAHFLPFNAFARNA
jgi:hypothetical protein